MQGVTHQCAEIMEFSAYVATPPSNPCDNDKGGSSPSSSDSESDSHGVSVQMLPALVVMKCVRRPHRCGHRRNAVYYIL